MTLFEFDDYRKFLKAKIEEFPNSGHGKMSEISRAIGVHPTLVSQVIKGHKELSSDQIVLVAKFFGLTDLETEYLCMLLSYNRAGNSASKKFFKEKLLSVRSKSKNLSERVTKDRELSEEQKAIYYSDWTYAAICQAVALERVRTVEDVVSFLNLPKERVVECVEFLMAVGLVLKEGSSFINGVATLHLQKSSPWIKSHHCNWRQKAIENFSKQSDEDLHYSAPLTLSQKDAQKLHERFIKVIEEMRSVVDPSPSEEFFCLNIDWFKVCKEY
jgi:uncharacterized protein (TIGR02147 family)